MPTREIRHARKCNCGCYYFMFKKKTVKRFAQCHVFAQSPPGRRSSDKCPVQSTLRTAPDLCKNVVLQSCLVVTVIHIQSLHSQTCVYIRIFFNIEMLFGQKKWKNRTTVNAACQGNLSACRWFATPGLIYRVPTVLNNIKQRTYTNTKIRGWCSSVIADSNLFGCDAASEPRRIESS
jgi:hypothetical protein